MNDVGSEGEPAHIEGQVANLTDVDQGIIDRLADAFNAEELTPP